MAEPLRLLVLEELPSEAEPALHALRRAGFDPACSRAATMSEFLALLDGGTTVDLIIAAEWLPQHGPLDALLALEQRALDIPLIVMTGAVDAEQVAETMRRGAADYVRKDQLDRLGPAVRRALEDRRRREDTRRAAEALRVSEERYRAVAELSSDYAYAFRIDADGVPVREWATEAFFQITGTPRDAAGTLDAWVDLVHPDDAATAINHIQALLAGQGSTCDFRIVTRAGEIRWLRSSARPVWDATGARVIRIYGAAQDITDRRRLEQSLERQALHDALTGLPNRALLLDRLHQAVLAAVREETTLAFMIIDLDRFKEVNDTFGHHMGDLLLRAVGERLRTVLRESDTVARLGGDEFAVVLPRAGDAGGATQAAHRIVHALEAPFTVAGATLSVGMSVGIALCPDHGADAATLMRRADAAMYSAKHAGSGYAVYIDGQDEAALDRLALLAELRIAIDQGEVLLHYQPQIDVASGRTVRLEALARWRHPRRGAVPPDQFVPLAERNGVIQTLTLWVFNAALRQLRSWREAGLDLGVSVNLSGRSLRDPKLPEHLAALLAHWRLPAGLLSVEIAESSLMVNTPLALDGLERLRAVGLRVAIDDFGLGYSALSSLKRLPVDEIKVDRSLVMSMASDPQDAAIVRSIIDLGHNLGVQVVAEGVENEQTWDMLMAAGCDLLQGYYLQRPVAASDLESWLRDSRWHAEGGLFVPGP